MDGESIINELEKLCRKYKCELIVRNEKHCQILGKLLVNYYPYSKRKTAYIAGTTEGINFVEPEAAVKLSLNPVKGIGKKAKRSSNNAKYKRWKKKQIEINPFCCWCNKVLTIKEATIEHIVPLRRGGLDNPNNWKLACESCNHERGHNMPELTKRK